MMSGFAWLDPWCLQLDGRELSGVRAVGRACWAALLGLQGMCGGRYPAARLVYISFLNEARNCSRFFPALIRDKLLHRGQFRPELSVVLSCGERGPVRFPTQASQLRASHLVQRL